MLEREERHKADDTLELMIHKSPNHSFMQDCTIPSKCSSQTTWSS